MKLNLDPNIFKCAAAGKTTLTDMVQIIPTNAQSKLNEGMHIETKSAIAVRMNLMAADAIWTFRSLVK